MTTPETHIDDAEDTEVVYCHRRNCPGSTGLRCYRTGVPICMKCAIRTPVGYISPEAHKQQADKYYNINPADYLIAASVALAATLLIGFPLMIFLGRIWFLMFFIAPAVGGAIGEVTVRAIGNRRGRYLRQVVGGAIIFGVLGLMMISLFSAIIFGVFAIGAALARLQIAL
jgi:hypothetical protein